MHYISLLLKQNHELETKIQQQPNVNKLQVIEALKDKWDTERQQEQEVAGKDTTLYSKTLFLARLL